MPTLVTVSAVLHLKRKTLNHASGCVAETNIHADL